MNCLAGFAHHHVADLEIATVSLQLQAAPAVTPAVIRFAYAFPAATGADRLSWVTLPSAPIGLIPISAPARAATAARKKVSTDASAPSTSEC